MRKMNKNNIDVVHICRHLNLEVYKRILQFITQFLSLFINTGNFKFQSYTRV